MSPRLYSVFGRSGSSARARRYSSMAEASSPASDSLIPASCSSSARLLGSLVTAPSCLFPHGDRIDPPPQNHPRHFCTKRALSRSAAAARRGTADTFVELGLGNLLGHAGSGCPILS